MGGREEVVSDSTDAEERGGDEESEASDSESENESSQGEEEVEEEEEGKTKPKTRKGAPQSPPSSSAAVAATFPMSRVKRLIKSDGVVHLRITPDAVFLINKASEHFLEHFAEDAYARAVKECKKSVSYEILSSVVAKEKRYEFLSDFVPEKVRAKDALPAKLTQS